MDSIMQKLSHLSQLYGKTKLEFLEYSDTIKHPFKLSKEQISQVSYGITETSDASLQKYIDILNNDKNLNKLYNKLSKIKIDGFITILEYASKSLF